MKSLFDQPDDEPEDGKSHEHESNKDEVFPGDERKVESEGKSRRDVRLLLEASYPDWIPGHSLQAKTGHVQAARRARELAGQNLIERRRVGRHVEYRRRAIE